MKYKIITQRTMYSGNTIVYSLPKKERQIIKIIEADELKFNQEEIEVNSNNIDYFKGLDKNVKIGGVYKLPIDSISFVKNNIELDKVSMLGDPFYELYKEENNNWTLIDKHKCVGNYNDK